MTDDHNERKRLRIAEGELGSLVDIDDSLHQQFQPTACSVSVSHSYVSLVTKSPPPSPTSAHTTIHHTEDILAELHTTLRKQYVCRGILGCSALLPSLASASGIYQQC